MAKEAEELRIQQEKDFAEVARIKAENEAKAKYETCDVRFSIGFSENLSDSPHHTPPHTPWPTRAEAEAEAVRLAEEKRLREEAERLAAEEAERQRLAEIARLKKVGAWCFLAHFCICILIVVFTWFTCSGCVYYRYNMSNVWSIGFVVFFAFFFKYKYIDI
jgi:hypothetical protein